MTDELKALLTDAVSDSDLHGAEIPSINLYLDQIISLISDCNARGAERYRDRVLTKTMINNYSKEGLIKPIKGKKYTREQVLQMLYIYALKGTLSIGEIKRLLYGVYTAEEGFDGGALEACYDRFVAIKENNRAECVEGLDELMRKNGLDPENERDYFLTVLGAVSLSAYFKAAAEAMLEAHYPDPDAKKNEKNDKDKNEKPAKAEKSAKAEKPAKTEKPAKPEKPAKNGKADKSKNDPRNANPIPEETQEETHD